MPKVMLKFPDRTEPVSLSCQIEANRFTVTREEAVYQGSLVLTGPGEGWLNYAGRILPFYISQQQDELALWVNGGSYSLSLVNPEARRSGGATGDSLQGGEVKSPMPGTVLKVLVQPGDRVEANQPLVLMESMKMEMTLSAPQAATVTAVQCAAGQLVEMGALLVKLETSD
jgi:3-methylcrotonyl-CoA carboxylase alpha subunit